MIGAARTVGKTTFFTIVRVRPLGNADKSKNMKTDEGQISVPRVAFCFVSLAILTFILLKLDESAAENAKRPGESASAAAEVSGARLTVTSVGAP